MKNQMNPKKFIKWMADELKKERSIILPTKDNILKDSISGLIFWEGFKKDDLVIHEHATIKNHITITLKKHVKS